ncbi:8012_t:CDS:2 [Dentiscutata erythropus]|uniref:8012_t:CDS:1 n=1 Tax=Dentiscutata erythropus TaxID=1348616 RepID=A0A9N9J8W0_9GLOM|nr:8012_t:CDS:2 [Dentiscutata erythropus]
MVDMNSIKKTSVANEFLVQSMRQDNIYYVINSGMGVCTCPVGVSGAPCKHQGVIAIKYHIAMFNFIPSITPKDRIIYSYIVLDYFSEDRSFYALLRTEPFQKDQELLLLSGTPNESFDESFDEATDRESNNREDKGIGDISIFLEEIKIDYENSSSQLRIALDKFAEQYHRAKSKSIPRLVSFLYDLNHNSDPVAHFRSGSAICIQVEYVNRRKPTRSSSEKQKVNKENEDLRSSYYSLLQEEESWEKGI